jgi:tetratricopeptide (TPR) repeat protein
VKGLESLKFGIRCFLVFCFCGIGCTPALSQQTEAPSAIFRNSRPSVVFIIGGDTTGKPTVQGSGFIVGRDKIVTNHHVVAGTSSAIVVFSDGTSAPVTSVIADSATRDLIILGAKTGQRAALPLGDELSLQQGDPVYAIGAPAGLEFTLTDGIVSGFRNMDDRFLIQSTAAIGHGSSGGPLLNREGKVVGITSAFLSDTPGIYFSASIGDVKRLLRSPELIIEDFSEWAKNNTPKPEANSPGSNATAGTDDAVKIEQLIHQKKYDEAKAAIQAFAERNQNEALTLLLTGELDQKTGNREAALKELQQSVEKDPSNASGQFYCAISLYYARRFDEALEHESKSNQLSPSASDSPFLALLYYSIRDYKQAETFARKSLEADSNDESALSVLAGLAFHGAISQGDWTSYVQQLSRIDSDNFWVHVSQGYSALNQSKTDQAVTAFAAAEDDFFPDPVPYLALCHIYSGMSDFGKANDQVRAGLLSIPDDSLLLSEGVFVSLITRDNAEATRKFGRLEQLYPETSVLLSTGCLFYYGVGTASKALPYCARLTDQRPEDRTAHSNYGWAALDAGEVQIASNEFSKAYKLADADWSKLSETQVIDLLWGTALCIDARGDRKGTAELVRFIRKNHPSAATVTGLQQLPLLWSNITMQRIETILREYPN